MASNELTPNSEDRIMCVKVGKVKRENLYEMTRKYWKVDINRARRATHVLAIVNGIVEEVYNPADWKYTEDPKHIGRCEFLGLVLGDMNIKGYGVIYNDIKGDN